MEKRLLLLGTRGIPANHGGFETFAQYLALYLAERGWDITVYCQAEGRGPTTVDTWRGIRRVFVPVAIRGPRGTIIFDLRSTLHAVRQPGVVLTLGYNTAVFSLLTRLVRKRNLINMDGIEWKRDKWSLAARQWLRINEFLGCHLADHLIADHPKIQVHLESFVPAGKITMIPYGAEGVSRADRSLIEAQGLSPHCYALVIARPEPENSILEIVRAFSKKPRGHKLVVLGTFFPDKNPYHRKVLQAASSDVRFPGAIYDIATVQALRFYARLYIHGHTVGGTNPSLVEALGAGNAVLAHDNGFNRWVSGPSAAYFSNEVSCSNALDTLLANDARLRGMATASRQRYEEAFTWPKVLSQYEQLVSRYL